MPDEQRAQTERPSWMIRAATVIGRSVGRWQSRRTLHRDEAFVRRWQSAWTAGRDARWGGVLQDAVPYRRAAQRQAWLAGWLWADKQPDRRNPLRPDRRTVPRPSTMGRVEDRRRQSA